MKRRGIGLLLALAMFVGISLSASLPASASACPAGTTDRGWVYKTTGSGVGGVNWWMKLGYHSCQTSGGGYYREYSYYFQTTVNGFYWASNRGYSIRRWKCGSSWDGHGLSVPPGETVSIYSFGSSFLYYGSCGPQTDFLVTFWDGFSYRNVYLNW